MKKRKEEKPSLELRGWSKRMVFNNLCHSWPFPTYFCLKSWNIKKIKKSNLNHNYNKTPQLPKPSRDMQDPVTKSRSFPRYENSLNHKTCIFSFLLFRKKSWKVKGRSDQITKDWFNSRTSNCPFISGDWKNALGRAARGKAYHVTQKHHPSLHHKSPHFPISTNCKYHKKTPKYRSKIPKSCKKIPINF